MVNVIKMANVIKMFVFLFMVVFLTQGCSLKTPGEFFEGFTPRDRSAEVIDCRTWVQTREARQAKQFDQLQGNDKAFALMHHDTMDMVKSVFGKGNDMCSPGTNEFDAYIVYVKEQGETNRTVAKESGSTLRFGMGVTGAVVAIDKFGSMAGDKVEGDKTVAGRDTVKTNGEVSVAGTNTQTTTTTSDRISQINTAGTNPSNSNVNTTPATPAEEPVEPLL